MDKSKILTKIGENVRNLMIEKGYTSVTLANKCKISTGSISKIIKGDMSMTIPMAINLAEGLDVDFNDLFQGIATGKKAKSGKDKEETSKKEQLFIGVMSINNKRFTCIKDKNGNIIGKSVLAEGLDLAETPGPLLQLINESIFTAIPSINSSILKQATLNLVTQSYEFEETRSKFILYIKKYFKDVLLLPDWQITYLATFDKSPGLSLTIDKGVSLSYKHDGVLKKLGGWKFPVYDLGGENWLGVETIHHTIEAAEGYIPMTKLAQTVLGHFGGKIEKITEVCFKGEGAKDADIYRIFSDILLRCYLNNDPAAKQVIEHGFEQIYRSVARADAIIGKPLKITINGALAEIYKEFFDSNRLVISPSDEEKVALLADLTRDYLIDHGIQVLT